MNKNRIALLTVLILTSITIYLFLNNKQSTLKEELRDFVVKDTASITRIFLADKSGKTIKLDKLNPNQWKVNDKYDVRNDAIENLLTTIGQVDVKSPVPKAAMENVIRLMAANSTKIEIYQGGNKPTKVYYVGIATKDYMGTYMLMENSAVPFVTHIKGFDGFLTTRYFTEEDLWRKTNIYSYRIEDIESVEINYTGNGEKSFIIEDISAGLPIIKTLENNVILSNIDTALVYEYLELFTNLNFEMFANEVTQQVRDSLVNVGPLFTIKVKDVFGKEKTLTAFKKPIKEGAYDNFEGKPLEHDIDRMCAYIDNKDFVIIQYYVFDYVTIPYKYFLKNSN